MKHTQKNHLKANIAGYFSFWLLGIDFNGVYGDFFD